MRLLSREELRGMKIVTADDVAESDSGAAGSRPMPLGERRARPINDRSWVPVERRRQVAVTRSIR